MSRAEARVVIESRRRHYNEVRPHSSLGYLTPAAFAAKIREQDAAPAQATGRSAAVCGSLRAPPRRATAPQGASQGSNEGGRLKLSVARKNRAGHYTKGAEQVRLADAAMERLRTKADQKSV